jgi:hypothetical protein
VGGGDGSLTVWKQQNKEWVLETSQHIHTKSITGMVDFVFIIMNLKMLFLTFLFTTSCWRQSRRSIEKCISSLQVSTKLLKCGIYQPTVINRSSFNNKIHNIIYITYHYHHHHHHNNNNIIIITVTTKTIIIIITTTTTRSIFWCVIYKWLFIWMNTFLFTKIHIFHWKFTFCVLEKI